MKTARKNSEANLQNTPESITAIFSKYNPQAPNTGVYYKSRQTVYNEAKKLMELISDYVKALTDVKKELDVLKVAKQDVVVRNQYKKIVDAKIGLWSKMLNDITAFYEYIRYIRILLCHVLKM